MTELLGALLALHWLRMRWRWAYAICINGCSEADMHRLVNMDLTRTGGGFRPSRAPAAQPCGAAVRIEQRFRYEKI
jgi:hypothetical protein